MILFLFYIPVFLILPGNVKSAIAKKKKMYFEKWQDFLHNLLYSISVCQNLLTFVTEIMQSEIYTGWFSSHWPCSPLEAEESGLVGEIKQVIGGRSLLFHSSIRDP
jgi:hypothetical protein